MHTIPIILIIPIITIILAITAIVITKKARSLRACCSKEIGEKISPTFTPLTEEQDAARRRCNNLFNGTPVHNGREWKTLSVEELVQVCLVACDSVYIMHDGKHTLNTILQEIIDRCRTLANWMDANKYRRFYMDSDMSDFIVKPRAVADILAEKTTVTMHQP
jgi:hypothetical protein